jgi:hypothetical protein
MTVFGPVLATALWSAAAAHAQTAALALNGYHAEAHSAAVSIGVGDRFRGPGPITVGWLGAKKQILIPNGEWVLIAAADLDSRHRPPAPLTALAFAHFDDRGPAALLVAVFTRRPGNPVHTWSDFSRCEADAPGRLWQEVPSRFPLGQCMLVEPMRSDLLATHMPEALWAALVENLPRLGIAAGSLQFTLKSTLYAVDNRGSYLQVRRLDRLAGGAKDSRVAWAREYLPLAAQGFRRDLDGPDLTPVGAAAARPPLKLPD